MVQVWGERNAWNDEGESCGDDGCGVILGWNMGSTNTTQGDNTAHRKLCWCDDGDEYREALWVVLEQNDSAKRNFEFQNLKLTIDKT